MITARKKQIFKAIKFRTIKIAKFYSSEIKCVYSKHFAIYTVKYIIDLRAI